MTFFAKKRDDETIVIRWGSSEGVLSDGVKELSSGDAIFGYSYEELSSLGDGEYESREEKKD